ncbi:hypothetical protein [Halorussus litoreus]|uniref:hypothetical protein n=1 Tax=Halorussus litoreus TaxID=1710536 RepID=UPI000E24834D|nr:hypothetical protein [Halorussus litoreus]
MSNSNTASSGWSSEADHSTYLDRLGVFVLKGVAIAVLAGMGAFVYNATQFLTFDLDSNLLLVPIFAAGSFAHLFASSLRESIRLGMFGIFGGLVVFVAAWIAPLWILPYSTAAIDIVLPSMIGEALSAAFLNWSPTYLGGYLLTLSVSAFWE